MSELLPQQVEKSFYDFTHYMSDERWMSYYHQALFFHRFKHHRSVVEIGAALNLNRQHVKEFLPHMDYRTLDIAEDLSPDILGSVHDIPLEDNSVDLIVAYEILEHLPFEKFEIALSEIRRVAKHNVIISLPHFGPPIKFLFKFPFLPQLRFAVKIPYPRKHVFNGHHYWEIGKRGYTPARIRKIIAKYFTVMEDFVPFENQYHHFFVLKVD